MRFLVKIAAIVVFITLFRNGSPAKILSLMGCASHSHHLWNNVLFENLAKRGHTLTVVSLDTNDKPIDNVSLIHLEETYNVINEHYSKADFSSGISGPFADVRMLYDYHMVTCKGILKSNGFQEVLRLDEQFDLILFDLASGPCLLRLIQKYPNAPVVGISAFKMSPEILEIFGGHNYPAYVPLFINKMQMPMNYWQRMYNAATYTVSHFYKKYITDPIVDSMVSRYLPGPKPTLESLYLRMQVALVNTHSSIDNALSLPPNIIEIGGLHIKEPQDLPEDIKLFIEEGEDGAVLIALGTLIKAEMLGEKRLQEFVNVIKKLPQYNFVWKIETEGLIKEIPENLLIRKWLPQNDILGHPNLKAFFTHAGGLSLQEATWHGVPVVAMPFMVDQILNAERAKSGGYGKIVDFKTLSEESLFEALSAVLTDDTYSNTMLENQRKFRDRQNKPLDTAIWWIEYILRNPRANHFSTASRDMSYFVSNSLDVLTTFLVLCVAFLINLWIVLRNIKGTLAKQKVKSSKIKSSHKKKVKKNE